jgi:teichuronic acid biosynthesis glycosyltransferase TuaC
MDAWLEAEQERSSQSTSSSSLGRRLHVLSMTTLFPSLVNPRHGIFVETRLRKVLEQAPVALQVIAPVPWFPLNWRMAGRYADYAAVPRFEIRYGVPVRHPRYLVIPRIGMALQPDALATVCTRAAREMIGDGWQCDVIDAHYLYPDGVAAAEMASELGKPLVVTARGSDVNLIAQMRSPQRRILAALEVARRVIAVSSPLKRELVRIGVPEEKIEVLGNGVDPLLFTFTERESTRQRLGIGSAVPVAVSVGNLVPEKGHDLVLTAIARLPDVHLLIVGRGPERERLARQAADLGIARRVQMLDNMSQSELAKVYSAADVLTLGSTREGWPNVVLEALSCGTPVVATDVGAVPDIVAEGTGEVVHGRDAADFAAAIARSLSKRPDRAGARAYAERFSWDPIARRYFEILAQAAHRDTAARGTANARPVH